MLSNDNGDRRMKRTFSFILALLFAANIQADTVSGPRFDAWANSLAQGKTMYSILASLYYGAQSDEDRQFLKSQFKASANSKVPRFSAKGNELKFTGAAITLTYFSDEEGFGYRIGKRTWRFDFHAGYKKNALTLDKFIKGRSDVAFSFLL